MAIQNRPHYELPSSELARWLEQQGADRWWTVDGDPILGGRLALPASGDALAAALRAVNRPLLLADKDGRPEARGQIAVDDAAGVGVGQCLARLHPQPGYLARVERLARLGQHGIQPAAVDELHGVVLHALLAADREDRHDIGVVQTADRLGLALKALEGLGVGRASETQHLQGHAPAQRQPLGLGDHPHAAAPSLAHDPEIAELDRRLPGGGRGPVDESRPDRHCRSSEASSRG